jgi:hypothetical protein
VDAAVSHPTVTTIFCSTAKMGKKKKGRKTARVDPMGKGDLAVRVQTLHFCLYFICLNFIY